YEGPGIGDGKPHGGISSLAFGPGGKVLAAGGDGVKVRLWDAATGELLREVKAHYAIDRSVALSADGKFLAATDGVGLRLWDAATGKDLLDHGAPRGLGAAVAFAPDGRPLAPADPRHVRARDGRPR